MHDPKGFISFWQQDNKLLDLTFKKIKFKCNIDTWPGSQVISYRKECIKVQNSLALVKRKTDKHSKTVKVKIMGSLSQY